MSKRCDNCGAPWAASPTCRYCREPREADFSSFSLTSTASSAFFYIPSPKPMRPDPGIYEKH